MRLCVARRLLCHDRGPRNAVELGCTCHLITHELTANELEPAGMLRHRTRIAPSTALGRLPTSNNESVRQHERVGAGWRILTAVNDIMRLPCILRDHGLYSAGCAHLHGDEHGACSMAAWRGAR